MSLTLVIANKNYSSWSLRAYLALAHNRIPFEEVIIPLGQPDTKARILQYSPAGKVPVLLDGKARVWESMAILLYLGERFPAAKLWPAEGEARAHALSIAAEMHAGFQDLRRHCPMNLRRHRKRALTPEVAAEVKRVSEIWRYARERFGKGGDFLFGSFGAADCMYAPVAARIRSYEIPVDAAAAAYGEAIYGLPAFRAWQEAALQETWSYPSTDMVD